LRTSSVSQGGFAGASSMRGQARAASREPWIASSGVVSAMQNLRLALEPRG
jgi:hypothetical protein